MMAQQGPEYYNVASLGSQGKEWYDILFGKNTINESHEDMAANDIGRQLGNQYPNGSCDTMVQQHYKKTY